MMFENLFRMASEQSFSIVLLLTIAYVLWRTMRKDLLKKDLKYVALEAEFRQLEAEFRTCIQKHQEDSQNMMFQMQQKYEVMMVNQNALMERTAEALEHNTAVLEAIRPIVENFKKR